MGKLRSCTRPSAASRLFLMTPLLPKFFGLHCALPIELKTDSNGKLPDTFRAALCATIYLELVGTSFA